VKYRPLAVTGVLVAVVLWSLGFPVTEIALQSTSPAFLSVARFAITAAVLLPFAARDASFRSVLRAPSTALLALTGVALYYALSHTALSLSTAGTIALAGALSPVLTAVVAGLLLRERIRRRDCVALILTTAGVGSVAVVGFRVDPGVLVFIVAMMSYAVYTVLLRRNWSAAGPSVLSLSAATSLWGTVLLCPWLLLEIGTTGLQVPSGTGWAMIVILSAAVTAPAAVFFAFGAERLRAVTTGTLTATGPPVGYAIAIAFGESPEPTKIAGGLVALLGVAISVVPLSRSEVGRRADSGGADSS
jgi:drug/metabolite transporter (DMT)-like permease